MRTTRFYIPQSITLGDVLQVPDNTARHMVQVLRLQVSDEVILFTGNNIEYQAIISEIKKKFVLVKIVGEKANSIESPVHIHLIQAISKGDRMDWVIQKAVELGVASILPVTSERTNVSLKGERQGKKLDHWQGVINSACEQCGRNHIPNLHPLQSLGEAVSVLSQHEAHRIILDPRSENKLQSQNWGSKNLILAIGPEGGFSEQEVEFLLQSSFQSYNLGPRILRTETAAIAGISLLQAFAGDL